MIHLWPNPKEIRSHSRLTYSFVCLLLQYQSISYKLGFVVWNSDPSPLPGFGAATSVPPRSTSICVVPKVLILTMQVAFLTGTCSWKTISPGEGDQGRLAALWELYLQDPVLVPSETLLVPRPAVCQSAHQTEMAAVDCVPCVPSKHFTCSRSPGGSCGGSFAGLSYRCASHVLADHGQGLSIY